MKKHLLLNTLFLSTAIFMLFTGCGKTGSTPQPTPPVVLVTKITSLSPSSGRANTSVVIAGSGFSALRVNNKVLFNGKEATVMAASATELTVVTPADAGTGAVTLSVSGTAPVTGPTFTYINSAKIISIDKTEGPYNTLVTITGTGFGEAIANNRVYFNGKEATVTEAGTTQLKALVPLAAGTGAITLSVSGTTPVAGPLFNYQLSYIPVVFAGGSTATGGFVNGPDSTARFAGILDLAFDASDNLYAVDNANYMVRKITPAGLVSSYIGRYASYGDAYNGTLSTPHFSYVVSLALDASGNFYIGESDTEVIRVSATGANTIITLPITASDRAFPSVNSICTDAAGNVFVANYSNKNVLKINPSGVASVFAGSAKGISGFANGTGGAALFNGPNAITIDKSGNLYLNDFGSQKIRKITPDGVVSTFIDITTHITTSLTMDSNGNMYVAGVDYLGQYQIVKIAPDGQKTVLIALPAEVMGMAVNKNNELFYSDTNRIYKLVYQ